MSKMGRKKRRPKNRPKKRIKGGEPGIADSIRQLMYPSEYRIAPPAEVDFPITVNKVVGETSSTADSRKYDESLDTMKTALTATVIELSNCLWYLKTKFYKREWTDHTNDDDDPRVRRALGRINKSIDTLSANRIEVQDPTNRRYPEGGEGMMRPIQFQPTAGLTYEKVSETVTPIIYYSDRLIQRGEVFVAVPQNAPEASPSGDGSQDAEAHGDPGNIGDTHCDREGTRDEK